MRKPMLLALGACLAWGVSAQQQPPPYLMLHQEIAKPAMASQYEASVKEFIGLVKSHRDKMPHFAFEALMGTDFTYTYVLPLANMGTMDQITAEFGALAQVAGSAYSDLNKRSGAYMEFTRESIFQLAPELSYNPTPPRLKPSEASFHHYDLYYVLPGREPDADKLGEDFVKLYKSKNVAMGYNIYKLVMGNEMPLYAVSTAARDAADFAAETAKNEAALGAEGKALGARAMALTRRFEQRDAIVRPDLSLPR